MIIDRPNEARAVYEKLQSHPNVKVSKIARQFMFSFQVINTEVGLIKSFYACLKIQIFKRNCTYFNQHLELFKILTTENTMNCMQTKLAIFNIKLPKPS